MDDVSARAWTAGSVLPLGRHADDGGDGGHAAGVGAEDKGVGGDGVPGLAHGEEAAHGEGREADEDLGEQVVREVVSVLPRQRSLFPR